MADDIRVKFTANGSSYKKQLEELVQQNKTLKSEVDKVKSSTDENTTAQEKAAKVAEAIKKQIKGQEETVKAMKAEYERLSKAEGDNTQALMKQEEKINKAEIALNKMNDELGEAEKAADGYGEETEDAAKHTDELSEAARMLARQNIAEIFNKIGDAAGKIATSAYESAKELDVGYDTIIKKTGATGKSFDELKKSADNVFGELPSDMSDVGAAIGEVNTRFGLTGKQLERTSSLFLKFADITDTDVNSAIGTSSRLLKTFGGDVQDADKYLGYLAAQSQKTGIDTTTLMNALDQSGATLRSMGLDLQQSTRLLALFEQNGVDSTGAMVGLRKAVINGAKDGKDFQQVFAEAAASIKNASTETEAMQIATELFGTKGAVVMADGIRSGRISLDELTESLETYGSVVEDTFEATLDPWDKAKVAIDNLKVAGSELAGSALQGAAPLFDSMADAARNLSRWIEQLPDGAKMAIAAIGGFVAISPKVISVFNTIQSFKAARTITQLGKLENSASGLSGSLGGVAKGFGIVSAAVGASVTAILAANKAIKNWRMENDEAYASAMRYAAKMKELKDSAKDYGTYLEDLRCEIKAESDMEMTAAERAQSAAQKITALRERQREAEKNYTIAKQELIEKLGSEEKAEEALRLGQIDLENASTGLMRSLDGLFGEVVGGYDAYNNAVAAMEDYNASTEESDELIAELTKTLEENGYTLEEAEELANDFGEAVEDMADDVEDAAGDLEDSFSDIYDAAKADIEASISIFDEWADESGKSMNDVAATMAKNAKAMANWSSNVSTLTKDARYRSDANFRGLVDSLVAMEGKGSVAMQEFADAVRRGDDAAIASWLNTTQEATKAKDNVVAQMTALKTGAGNAVTQLGQKMSEMPTAAGRGLAGYKNKMGEYVTIATDTPTKIAAQLNAGNRWVVDASNRMGASMGSGLPSAKSAQTSGGAYPVNVAAGMNANLNSIKNAAYAAALATKGIDVYSADAYWWGQHLAQNYADGMNRKLGEIRQAAYSAAQSIANYWGHTTPKMGPMANDDEWGVHFMENWINAIRSQKNRLTSAVMQAAEAVATPMLDLGVDGINSSAVSNSFTYGDMNFTINAQDGQSAREIAQEVKQIISQEYTRERMAWA